MFWCKLGPIKKSSAFPFLLTYFLVMEFTSLNNISDVSSKIDQIMTLSIFLSFSSFLSGIFELVIFCRQSSTKSDVIIKQIEENYNILTSYSSIAPIDKSTTPWKVIFLYILIIIIDATTNFFFHIEK